MEMTGIPAADRRAMLAKVAPPRTNISACSMRLAPALSTSWT